jgi:nucleoside-diphosphate-sugar epimerase
MKNRCVSITGASGFLGAHLIAGFAAAGWQVRAVVRPGSPVRMPAAVDRREAALQDVSALTDAFAGADAVVHAAGVVRAASQRAFDAVNVAGTAAVVQAVNAVGARLVHISSLAAIGPGTAQRPAREDDPPRPVNAYGRSKLAAELVVRTATLGPWLILRPCAVYGPGDRGFLPLVRLARWGLFPLAAPAAMPFTFVYAEDVADAVCRAAASDVTGDAFFIGHRQAESAGSMLDGIARILARAYRPVPVPRFALGLAGRAGDLLWKLGGSPLLDSARVAEFSAPGFVCDVSRASSRLGFTAAVPLSDGLARTIRWYREHGWL